ncbi:MAG: hypothetical protein IIA67_01440, partial [Planctomycetes bacterium]|nr:hypothetical protein [Planctomycetota bacterium]
GDLAGLNGVVGLNLNSPSIADLAGNPLPNTEPPIDETYTVDNTPPSATSFTRKTPTAEITNADILVFLATFSEDVLNVDAADFAVTGTTGTIAVAQVTASTYDVTISGGDLAGLNGVVGLNLNSPSIADLAGNPLPGTEPPIDETYTVDNTAPSTTSFTRKTPTAEITNADILVFLATFSEDVLNVDAADFAVTGTTGTIAVTQVTASSYDVTISGGDLAGLNATVGLNLNSPSIADLAGNALPNTEPPIDETYTVAPRDLVVDLPSGNGANDVTLRRNGLNVEVFDNNTGTLIATQLLAETDSVTINGSNVEDDVLTVDYAFGGFFALPGGVWFDGGSSAGDGVTILGDGLTTGRFVSSDTTLANARIETSRGGQHDPVHVAGIESLTIDHFGAFEVEGELHVADLSFSIAALGYTPLGFFTTIDGGTITAEGGLLIGAGDRLRGQGTIDAAIVAELGSTISLTGNLTIGDALAFDGFVSNGRLNIGDHTLTLLDGHKAVLGSQTTLGADGNDGTLDADQGVALEDNRTLVGQGQVNTLNGQFENQGFVQGNGTGITFNHLVTGAGDFGGTITFLGGHEPGDSPAQIDMLGNVIYGPANVLTLEIGGLIPGEEFDRIDVTGEAVLDGVLRIEPIRLDNDFEFQVGDRFELLTFGSHVGDFSSYEGLQLDGGLSLRPTLSDSGLQLTVVRSLAADLTGDGFVDFQDLTILLANWNLPVSAIFGNLIDPLNTLVNFQDLTSLLAQWTGPGPVASPPAAAAEAAASTRHATTPESLTATAAHFDRLGRRDRAASRRTSRVSSPNTPLGRLHATAVDRAMLEHSELARGLIAERHARRSLRN